MAQQLSFVDGQFIAANEAAIALTDAGFVLGTTVAEQLRTCRGELFRIEQHFARLVRSQEIVGIEPQFDTSQLIRFAKQLVEHNHALVEQGDDIGLCVFVTPGPYWTFEPHADRKPLVCMHTYHLPFNLWYDKYETGERLIVSDVRQVPAVCWPTELKCRSRMHYFLADRQARQIDPKARALLLDVEGNVAEASTASVLLFRHDEGLVAPPTDKILPGISLTFLAELAAMHEIPLLHRELKPAEFRSADEVLLCSTSPCLLPVCWLDGAPIGDGKPGNIYRRLILAWSESVGVDIPQQAKRFATRASQ